MLVLGSRFCFPGGSTSDSCISYFSVPNCPLYHVSRLSVVVVIRYRILLGSCAMRCMGSWTLSVHVCIS